MTIQTRKPTGKPPWPILLLAGGEKAGKSYAAAEASASDLIDRTFWIGIGEDDPDEYGAIPGARFEIVPHNGTYQQILARLKEAVAEPAADGKQNLIVVDSGTRLWEMLSDEANAKAVSRAEAKARKYNRTFDGEVTIGPDLWNKAAERWQDVMDLLRLHSGPSIITARLEVVMVMDDKGNPTKDKTSKVKAHKSLPFDVGAIVEMPSRGEAYISGLRSLKLDIPVGEKKPYKNFTVDGLWRALGIDQPGATTPRQHSAADGHASATEEQQTSQQEQQQRPAPNPNEDAGAQALHARQAAARQQQGPDWKQLFQDALGNRTKLEALRHSAKNAGAPDDSWLITGINKELKAITEAEQADKVLEGAVV